MPTDVTPRRRRMSSEVSRRRMLQTGRDLVWQHRLVAELADLPYDEIIRTAGVPRSTVFRIWPSRQDFMVELLRELVSSGPHGLRTLTFDDAITALADQVVAEHPELMATGEGRHRLLREVVRQVVGFAFDRIVTAPGWRAYATVLSTADSMVRDRALRPVAVELGDTEQGVFVQGSVATWARLFSRLGLRMRDPDYRLEHLVVVGASVVEGLAIRTLPADVTDGGEGWRVLREVCSDPVPGPAIDGDSAPWCPAALAYLGVIEAYAEIG